MPMLTVEPHWEKIWFVYVKKKHQRYFIAVGSTTIAAEGLFKVFVVGKRINKGKPTHYEVNINRTEARIFKMIHDTCFERKRSFWAKVNSKEITKEEALSKLSKELPTLALMKKLDTRRTSYA